MEHSTNQPFGVAEVFGPAPSTEHVVFFTTPAGDPAAERYQALAPAIARVEELRNHEGVLEASVFGLLPVTLAVKQYFRVEVVAAPGADVGGSATLPAGQPNGHAQPADVSVDGLSQETGDATSVDAAPWAATSEMASEATGEAAAAAADAAADDTAADVVADVHPETADLGDVLPAQPTARARGRGFFVH